jgi:hypothetical protein
MDSSRPFYRSFLGPDSDSSDSSGSPAMHGHGRRAPPAARRRAGTIGTAGAGDDGPRIHMRRGAVSASTSGAAAMPRRRGRGNHRSDGVVGTPKSYAREPSPSDFDTGGDDANGDAMASMYDEGRPRTTRAETLRAKGIRGEILDFPPGMVPEKKQLRGGEIL